MQCFTCDIDVSDFTQFIINGQWQPPLPHQRTVFVQRGPILVEDVLGIWWGDPFPGSVPPHIGVVVSKRTALKNTLATDDKSRVA